MTKEYPFYTPYQFAGNTPIQAIDLDGLEPKFTNTGSRIELANGNSLPTEENPGLRVKPVLVNTSPQFKPRDPGKISLPVTSIHHPRARSQYEQAAGFAVEVVPVLPTKGKVAGVFRMITNIQEQHAIGKKYDEIDAADVLIKGINMPSKAASALLESSIDLSVKGGLRTILDDKSTEEFSIDMVRKNALIPFGNNAQKQLLLKAATDPAASKLKSNVKENNAKEKKKP